MKYYLFDDEINDRITEHALRNHCKTAYQMGIRTKALAFDNFVHNWGHKCTLDYETYKQILLKVGFLDVKSIGIHKSQFRELADIEQRHDFYTDFETLVLEARK